MEEKSRLRESTNDAFNDDDGIGSDKKKSRRCNALFLFIPRKQSNFDGFDVWIIFEHRLNC